MIVFSELRSQSGESVHPWLFFQIDERVRVYYLLSDLVGYGFDFYAIWACGTQGDEPIWNIDNTFVDVLFYGNAFWDGIRHLYMGHETAVAYGYVYCPDVDMLKSCLTVIQALEGKFCKPVN